MSLTACAARRSLPWVLVLALAAQAPAHAAQPQEAGDPRTGPEASPPSLPDYADPAPRALPEPQLPPEPASPPAGPPVSGPVVSSIDIEAPDEGPDSVPPPGWAPPSEDASGLRLDHGPGEPLDAAWVTRQFALNRIAGSGVDRAVALVQRINRAFVSAGFVNSGLVVPPLADAASGVLTIRLVHGRLVAPEGEEAAITVDFADGRTAGLDPDYARRRMPSARRTPINAAAIERDFRRLADDPAIRTVDAQLRPGSAPGEASLHLTLVPEDRFDLYLSAANDRSPSVGGERIAAGGAVRNLAASGDLLSGEIGLTRGVLDASLAYSAPILTRRTFLNLRGSFNRASVVDRPLEPLDIRSRDRGAEASLVHRLIDAPLMPVAEGRWSPSRQLSVGLGVAWRRQRSFLLGEPFSFAPGSVDGRSEYVAARLVGDYVQRNVDQVLAVSATATMGIDGTRSDLPFVLNPDRHYLSLLVQGNFARRLGPSGLELRARVTGQAATSVLYSSERLSVGGATSVRGYRETLILADQGLVGSVELALPVSLSGEDGRARDFDWGAFTISAFADAGTARNVDAPDPDPRTLAGVGVSLVWQPSDAVSVGIDYGIALIDARQTGSRDLQDRGIHFRFTLYPLDLVGG